MAKLTYLSRIISTVCGATVCGATLMSVAHAAPSPAQLDVLPTTTNVYTSYTVSWNMWWGENAQRWTLLSNGEALCTGELEEQGNSKQSGSCEVKFTPGEHRLVVELCNASGCSESVARALVAAVPELQEWQPDTAYAAGSFIIQGKSIYQAQWWTKNEQPPAKVWQFVTEQGASLSAEVANWQNNATAAYTIQHDDLCAYITDGIIHHAIPELSARGLQGSVGVIAGNCANYHWQAVEQFAAAGHEIYNHSWMHTNPVDPAWSDEVEIRQAQQMLMEKVPTAVEFYAFPQDQASAESIAALKADADFIGMRSVNYYLARGVNDADSFDPYFIKNDLFTNSGIWSVYEGSDDILRAYVDDAVMQGGWALRTFHGVEDTSWEQIPLQRYQGHLDYVKSLVDEGKLWVAGASDVIRYGMARRSCQMQSTTQYDASLVLSFDLSDPVCKKYLADDTQLSVVVSADQAVNQIAAHYQQADAAQQPTIARINEQQFVVNLLPRQGQVVITLE
ncbi:chitinase N-terminal domain-containing protein [Motilimonas eburnea]|uniref:chitinase N-terminal domain-containing protein n=1 Tax=Motilimonas eburnea TaxID=1737488 RepID=UPI001E2FBE46|nr:chitinase N-terminal domain-containing protein [Motilimonas eburnea]MCE2573126.1 polysaccharide deacetylase family protein [Motilimonas eburnea]